MIHNLTARQRCPYCGDDGLVVVDSGTPEHLREEWVRRVKETTEGKPAKVRAQLLRSLPVHGEQMGPCPKCEKGNLVEFPAEGKPGPWGANGYWQGRNPVELEARSDTPADPQKVKEYIAQLTEMVKPL